MIRDICKDLILLSQKSRPATREDFHIAKDLEDTLRAHADHCVGMAANMIGFPVRIISFFEGNQIRTFWNPVILKKEGEYETEEGCLSLVGVRPCVRYKEILVEYEDGKGKRKKKKFSDFTAEIVQHEMDHLNGIII